MWKANFFIAGLLLLILAVSVYAAPASNSISRVEGAKTDYWIPKEPPKVHYKIEFSFDPYKGHLEGKEVIHFKNITNRPISTVVIRRQNVNRTLEITANGMPVSVLEDNGWEKIVSLSETLVPDMEVEIEIKFSASILLGRYTATLPPTGWYPRLYWGFETHDDFDVKVDVPKEYKIAASGILDNSSGYYHAEGIRRFGMVLLKDVDIIKTESKDVVIQCYYHPDEKKCAELLLNTAADVVSFYRERFGFYPNSSLTIIPGEDSPMGGYPVATNIVSIHGMARMDEMPKLHWQWITAHEVGHQYWLEYVLSKDPVDDIGWLLIGLGIYADREYVGSKGLGMDKHRQLIERYIRGVREGHNTTINISLEDALKIDFDFNNVVIHGKGYSIISALDCLLGRDIFNKIYQRCLGEFGGRRLGATEFQAICEAESGQDLGWFFEQWLNSNKYLSYKITSKMCGQRGDIYISDVEVQREGDLRMPVPVEAFFEDGSKQAKFTNRLLDTNILRFESVSPLKDVRLDPENALALVIPPPSVTDKRLSKEVQRLPWTGAGQQARNISGKITAPDVLNADNWFKLGLTLYDGNFYFESLNAFRYAADRAEKGSRDYIVSKVWQGHNFDLLGQRSQAIECYKEALKFKQTGTWIRHDQYGMVIDQNWVKQRLEKPFERNTTK
jgi:tetratricopeptide (TPR) repeat protein